MKYSPSMFKKHVYFISYVQVPYLLPLIQPQLVEGYTDAVFRESCLTLKSQAVCILNLSRSIIDPFNQNALLETCSVCQLFLKKRCFSCLALSPMLTVSWKILPFCDSFRLIVSFSLSASPFVFYISAKFSTFPRFSIYLFYGCFTSGKVQS